MITFAEAMLIAHGEIEPLWTNGTLCILPNGFEDDQGFAVFCNSQEWHVGKNPEYQGTDNPVAFVDKQSGQIFLKPQIAAFDRLDAMRPVALTESEFAQYTKDVQGA